MRALDKNSRAQANYSGAILSILRAVAFCTRVFVKFKSSSTVANDFPFAHATVRARSCLPFSWFS